jgi:hypothetical protein
MASWREIDRVRKDANGARELAKRLLKIYPGELTEWEMDFLQSITTYTELFEFTTRQAEKLLEIRDDTQPVTAWRGFSVASMIRQCYEARLDLAEADEQWDRGPASAGRRRDQAKAPRTPDGLRPRPEHHRR